MNNNLVSEKIVSGLVWTYAERITAQIVTALVTIVLARIISPKEFGTVSLVTVFITLANVFVSEGFGNSLVQKQNADSLDFNSVLWFSLLFSIIVYLGVYIIAPYIAGYYSISLLTKITRVMGLRLPIAAINTIQHAYVEKKMEFKKFFFSTLLGTIISAFVGIGMALCGFGVWALVVQYLSNCIIDTIVLQFTIEFRPSMEFSLSRLKPMIRYGWKILAVGLLNSLYSNLRDLIIGKKYSIEDLAYSSKGRQFPLLIAININSSLGKVLFPAMSVVQHNTDEVKKLTRRSVSLGTFLLAPILCGLAAVSRSFVAVVITEKWLPCVPYLRIMCFVYLLQPIQTASLQAIKAIGRSDMYLRLEIIKKIFGIIILILSIVLYDTVFMIVLSALVAELISTFVNFPTMKRELNYLYKEQIIDIILPFIKAMISAVMAYLVGLFIIDVYVCLIIQVLVGIIVFVGICKGTHDENYIYIVSLVTNMVRRRLNL